MTKFKLRQIGKEFEAMGRGIGVPCSPVEPIPQKELIGAQVLIDGKEYTCQGVEWFAMPKPEFWDPNHKISILVGFDQWDK